MTTTGQQNRVPKGVPTGGEWAEGASAEPDLSHLGGFFTTMGSVPTDDDTAETIGESAETPPAQAEEDPRQEPSEQEPAEVRYSFIAEFEQAEEQFNTDFDGVPKRFFTADLRGKVLANMRMDDLDELHETVGEHEHRVNRYFDDRGLAGRLCHSVAAPAENSMSDEQAEQLLAELDNVADVQKIDDDVLLHTFSRNATRGWLAKVETVDDGGEREERWLAVTDAAHSKMAPYIFPRGRGDIRPQQQVTQTDLRSLAGAKRIENLTGTNPVALKAATPATRGKTGVNRGDYPEMSQDRTRPWAVADYGRIYHSAQHAESASMQSCVTTLAKVEEAQRRGQNFLAQQKFVRESASTIATAFDDKKHPDKTRQAMMAGTSLAADNGGNFSKVEIDNDVDPGEYADFESAIHDVESKLPHIPAHARPDLRIRKLGKHKAIGAYSAQHNTVAVDVRTSAAYIHEMGHYYDLAVKNNASLSAEFAEISRGYQSKLAEPDPKRSAYLNTPTEQLARGFEIYAHERLGVDNRLVDPSRFDGNDYAPYQDPKLKERLFAFFDSTFPR